MGVAFLMRQRDNRVMNSLCAVCGFSRNTYSGLIRAVSTVSIDILMPNTRTRKGFNILAKARFLPQLLESGVTVVTDSTTPAQ
jgi:hypothetical protein